MAIPCNNGISIPILETDLCQGSRTSAGCVYDSSIYSELGLSQDSTQQEINQAQYLAFLNLKATTDNIDATVSGLDGSETKIEAGDNVEITGSGTTVNPYIINSLGGGGTQDLQSVLDSGNEAQQKINISNGTNSRATISALGISASGYSGIELDNQILFNKSEIYFNKPGMAIARIAKNNILAGTDYTLELPAKTEGTYTLATTDQLRPYKVYTATLNQSGTSTPTSNILENSIGNIVWTRVTNGIYWGTLVGAFPENKTHLSITPSSPTGSYSIFRNSDDIIVVKTQDNGTVPFTDSDDKLFNNSIRIEVYN